MDNPIYELFLALVAGVVAIFAGLLSQQVTRKRRRELEENRREINDLVAVLEKEEASRKTTVMEKVIEKIPVGLSSEQFTALINEISTRLPTHETQSTVPSMAVENLINTYHEQALSQAKMQFWFSIIAASVGFAWILVAASDIRADNFMTISKTLPGMVIDAVAFLFFRQASETRQRATELYDRLRKDKLMTESVKLVASIEDLKVRSAVKAQIALHMSGLEPNPIDLTRFLSSESNIPKEPK